MAANQVALQDKKELKPAEERTEAGRYYSPATDIYETADAVVVTMDIPGVDRAGIDINLDRDVLTIVGRIDSKKYDGLEPIYSEYNVGNFSRRFTLSTEIDSQKISAQATDGVLTVTLPKAKAAVSRRIEVR